MNRFVGALLEQPDLGHLPVQLERGGFGYLGHLE